MTRSWDLGFWRLEAPARLWRWERVEKKDYFVTVRVPVAGEAERGRQTRAKVQGPIWRHPKDEPSKESRVIKRLKQGWSWGDG